MATVVKSASGIRFNEADRRLIRALSKKLGIKMAEIVRMALRTLAAKEGISA